MDRRYYLHVDGQFLLILKLSFNLKKSECNSKIYEIQNMHINVVYFLKYKVLVQTQR